MRPCSDYDLMQSDEQQKCFHWTNIRPLEKSENMKKSNAVDEILIQEHKYIVNDFLNLWELLIKNKLIR